MTMISTTTATTITHYVETCNRGQHTGWVPRGVVELASASDWDLYCALNDRTTGSEKKPLVLAEIRRRFEGRVACEAKLLLALGYQPSGYKGWGLSLLDTVVEEEVAEIRRQIQTGELPVVTVHYNCANYGQSHRITVRTGNVSRTWEFQRYDIEVLTKRLPAPIKPALGTSTQVAWVGRRRAAKALSFLEASGLKEVIAESQLVA